MVFSLDDVIAKGENQRKLAIVGGRLEDNNADIYNTLFKLSKGRILVFPTASAEPEAVGPETVEVFRNWGFDVTLVPLSVENAQTVAYDQKILNLVETYGSVFFTGGNQIFITDALMPNGVETPLLKKIKEMNQRGGLVSGSSAGAAMMSSTMIVGGTSLEATSFGLVNDPSQPGLLLNQGLNFFNYGIVDQHFIKRGRFGRLLIALAKSSERFGYGIDENTALFTVGNQAWVEGEYGIFLIDMQYAQAYGRRISDINFSYLDHGDAINLETGLVTVAQDKKNVTAENYLYSASSQSVRNVFGAYTLYDLLSRLVMGDPQHYNVDTARAYEPVNDVFTSVEIVRAPNTQSLIAVREDATRITALDFVVNVETTSTELIQVDRQSTGMLARNYGVDIQSDASIIMLGSNPVRSSASTLMKTMVSICKQPIGIIACASATPRSDAYEYIDVLKGLGIEAQYFDITIDNIDQASRDTALIDNLRQMETILLTGGNQIRLVEALLMRSEVTPVLREISELWAKGKPLIAIGGAASAMSGFMIAGGTSWEALKYGIASDLGRRGLVLQEGLGLFGSAIIDQNLATSRRLGRLVVACAEEGVRFGLGICEDSGIVSTRYNTRAHIVGDKGVVLIEIDQRVTICQGDEFECPNIKIHYALPGDTINLETGKIERQQSEKLAASLLRELIIDLIYECRNTEENTEKWGETFLKGSISIDFDATEQGSGILHIASLIDRR